MRRRSLPLLDRSPLIVLRVSFACAAPDGEVAADPCLEDVVPPSISTAPPGDPLVGGDDRLVEAIVQDDCDIWQVVMHVRAGDDSWRSTSMTLVGGDRPNGYFFQAVLRGDLVTEPEVAYFLEAVDGSPAGNRACAPAACDAEPFVWVVTAP